MVLSMISSCTLEKLRIKSVKWPLSCETPCRRFTKNENYRLLFDLCIILKGMGILSTAAIRKERMKGCENEMKKMDRVTHRYDKCVPTLFQLCQSKTIFTREYMGSSQQETHKYKLS